MGFVRRLVSVLKPEVLLTHRNDGVELLDKQSGMRVRLFGLPARFTAVHVEGIGHVGKLKDRGQEHNGHLRRVCDYVLVAESDDSTRVVFVELKGTWSTGEKPRDQLRRSLPLLNYLRSVCEVEYEEMLDEGRLSMHYAIVFEKGAALLRWRPNQSLRRRRGRRQLDPSRRGEERRRVGWPTVLLSSATDGGLPLVLARFVRGLSTHQGSGCPRRLRTAATAAKCHRGPVDSHRVADQMPTGPSMSRRRAPHAASPLPRG